MKNNNYYSDNSPMYNYENNRPNNVCNNDSVCNNNIDFENNHDDDKECSDNRERECCGKRFNGRTVDREVKRALKAFEKQLENTEDAIDCLNKVFNNLEDEIFEDRCCPSNRIKNILRSIQKEICDLQDDLQNIEDDFECLEQAL